MGLWGKILRAFSPQNYRGGTNPNIAPWLGGTRYDYVAEAGDLWTNSAVSICIKRKAAMKSELILRLGMWNAKEQRYDRVQGAQADVALAPFNRPNGYYTWSSLQEAIQLSYDCRGHAFVYKLRDDAGRVIGLYYLPHYAVRIETDSYEQMVTGYKYLVPGGGEKYIPYSDILMIRQGIDPRDMRCGLSPLQAEIREIAADNSGANRMGALLLNGMDGTIVSPKPNDNPLSLDSLRQLTDRLNQAVRDRLGMASFVPYPTDIAKIGYSPKDFEFEKVRAIPTDRICAALGADPMAFGLPSSSKTYNNLAEAMDALGRNAILPEATSWAEQMSYAMLPEFRLDPAQYRYYFDTSEVTWLADEIDQRHQRNREDFMAGIIDQYTAQSQIGMKPEASAKGVTYFDLQARARGLALPSDAQKKSLRPEILRMAAANLERLEKLGRLPGVIVRKPNNKGAAAQAQHDRLIAEMERDMLKAFKGYGDGRLTMAQLQEKQNALIYDFHRAMYRLGYQTGGGTPTDEMLDAYAQLVTDGQSGYMLGFLDDIANGRYNDDDGKLDVDGPLKTRTGLYSLQSSSSASAGFIQGSADDEEFDWTLGPTEHCEDCLYIAELGPFTKDVIFTNPREGDTRCLGNCACRWVRSDGLSPFGSPRSGA